MNKVILIGNLTRDPECTETSGGISICRFSIAVNRSYKSADGETITDFLNCVAWRGLAETAARYLRKGDKVCVTGSIELRKYEDRNGAKQTAVDIRVGELEFLTPKQRDSENKPSYSETRESREEPRQRSVFDKKPTLTEIDDDTDIPF